MAYHIRLGCFDWEEDRAQAVKEQMRRRYCASSIVVHSGLTIKGKLRKLFKITYNNHIEMDKAEI